MNKVLENAGVGGEAFVLVAVIGARVDDDLLQVERVAQELARVRRHDHGFRKLLQLALKLVEVHTLALCDLEDRREEERELRSHFLRVVQLLQELLHELPKLLLLHDLQVAERPRALCVQREHQRQEHTQLLRDVQHLQNLYF